MSQKNSYKANSQSLPPNKKALNSQTNAIKLDNNKSSLNSDNQSYKEINAISKNKN